MPYTFSGPDTGKKQGQLQRREEELRRALLRQLPRDRLIAAVENVRAARLSLLKAKHYWAEVARMTGRLGPNHAENIEAEKQAWLKKPMEEILGQYKPPASPVVPSEAGASNRDSDSVCFGADTGALPG